MKRFWPLWLLLVVVGCGDSRTASQEREMDSLRSQVSRLKEENAALRDRANALSLDLDYQKSLNKELQAKLKNPPIAEEPEKHVVEPPPKPKVAAREDQVAQPKPPVAVVPKKPTPKPAPPAEEAAVRKPPPLPDIRPKAAADKPAPPPAPAAAEPSAEKPVESATAAQPPKASKPVETEEDPFAYLKKPGFREPPAAVEADEGRPAKPQSPKTDVAGRETRPVAAEPPPPTVKESEPAPEKPRPAPGDAASRVSAPLSDLQLVDVTESRAGDTVHISGRVANNTNKGIVNVRVRAVFLDANGQVVASSECAVEEGARLDAGETGAFEMTSPPNARIARYRLTALADQAAQ